MPSPTVIPARLLPSLLLCAMVSDAGAASDPPALCVAAARSAAETTGVPFETLLAISVVETGRDRQPWPWTVNRGGEGFWLDRAEDAARLVADALDQGETNIDIGCFQLNYRWHAAAFQSVEDMLDPARNALYAAGYLADQYARTGDWAEAAAAYHSATPEYAERYRARYEGAVAELGDGAAGDALPDTRRVNGFPLLIAGAAGRKGSLVPSTPGGLRLVGVP